MAGPQSLWFTLWYSPGLHVLRLLSSLKQLLLGWSKYPEKWRLKPNMYRILQYCSCVHNRCVYTICIWCILVLVWTDRLPEIPWTKIQHLFLPIGISCRWAFLRQPSFSFACLRNSGALEFLEALATWHPLQPMLVDDSFGVIPERWGILGIHCGFWFLTTKNLIICSVSGDKLTLT